MLDLTKAFDSVSHDILLRKLNYYGVRGEPFKLLQSYLSGRMQVTQWQNTISDPRSIKYGVPQGSILGPLLFVVYINDLPSNVEGAEVCMYADDTSLLVRARNYVELQQKSENAISTASNWFAANKLKVNLDKSQKITFSTTNKRIPDEANFLGMVIDANLKWHGHIDGLANRLAGALYAIRRIKHTATHEAAKTTYFSCFHSLLSYGVLFWGTATEAHRIFILQKRAVRILCNLKYNESCRNYFKAEGILTLPAVYILAVVLYVHKNKYMFPLNGQHHQYHTRRRDDIRVPYHRLTATQKSLDFWGTKLYNSIPTEMKELQHQRFKIEVKKMLILKECYSLEEFLES